MRQVTGRRWVKPEKQLVPTADLLKQCNWLSVRQPSFYTAVLTVHKTLIKKEPEYFYEKLTSGKSHKTRAATKYTLERTFVDDARLKIATDSFRWRGHTQHSMIPDKLQYKNNLRNFT